MININCLVGASHVSAMDNLGGKVVRLNVVACMVAALAIGVSASHAQTPTADGAEFLINSTTTNDQSEVSVADLTDGGFVVVWADDSLSVDDASGSAIRGQRYTAGGAAVGSEFLVNTITTDDQHEPSVAGLAGGGFVVAWRDDSASVDDSSGTAVRAQRYTAAGVADGAEFRVNTTTSGNQFEPSVAGLAGGGFVISWTDASATGGDTSGQAIRAQRYTSAGAVNGAEFLVNTITTGSQNSSAAAGLTSGGFVITWRDSSNSPDDTSSAIRAQRYTSAGAVDGAEFLVNTITTGAQNLPDITALTGGGFVIAWQDFSGSPDDPSSGAIRAQRYDAAGAEAGAEFLVNTQTVSNQNSPTLAALAGGGFVVTWTENNAGGDGSGSSIRAQRYSEGGGRDGIEHGINTTSNLNQKQSDIAGLSGGGLVIAWTDESISGGDLSGSAIRGQRLSVPALDLLSLADGTGISLLTSDFRNQTVASEVGGTLDGDVIIEFGLSDAFITMGAAGVVEATFTLTNATFDGPLSAGSWTAASDADCDFGTPTFGGGAGGNVVRFENTGRLNQCSGSAANDGYLTLPIEVTNNGDPVSISVTFTPTADAGSYTGSSEDFDLLAFAPAFDFTISEGAAGAGEFDSQGDDLQGSGNLGTLELAAFPAGIEADIGVLLALASDIAASAELVLTFPGGAIGIDETDVNFGGLPCNQGSAPSDNVFTCPLTGGNLDFMPGAGPVPINIDDDGNAATSVTEQTPTAVFTVTGNPGNTVSGASGSLAEIEHDDGLDVTAITNSDFDWVRFGSGGTESNFRISLPSEAEAQAVTQVRVAITEGNGTSAGTVTLPPGDVSSGFRVQGATITFNSAALGTISGETGNANITSVSLQHDETALLAGTVPGLTILRMLVNRSPDSFVATPGLTND